MKSPTSNIQSPLPATPRVALVADWIYGGGAEKVLEALHELYPDAPIYTSYCSDEWRERLDGKVITGYLQHWPFSSLRRFLPLLRQWWFSRLDLSDFDLVISSSGNGESKFIRPDYLPLKKRLFRSMRRPPISNIQSLVPSAPSPSSTLQSPIPLHICYCHTPTHFYWAHYDQYLSYPSMRPYWLARLGLRLLVKPLRKRDFDAAQHVDYFIANSTSIQADIQKYYGRESTVIHPPINIDNFIHLSPRGEKRIIPEKPQCITWGRAVPAKRIDIAIEACNTLGWPLTVIGSGPDIDRLKRLAGPTISFPGYVSDKDRENYIRNADLFLFCAHEDFGVAPVEALAAGLPVVAYKAGGALDYVQDDVNGVFFDEQTADSLTHALRTLPGTSFDSQAIAGSVEQFSAEKFRQHISKLIDR